MTWVVRLARWGPDDIEHIAFETRAEAVHAAQAIVDRFADQSGGWSSCPTSHIWRGCQWAKVSRAEWKAMGWDAEATDRWRHCTRGDRWHKERIWVRPEEEAA